MEMERVAIRPDGYGELEVLRLNGAWHSTTDCKARYTSVGMGTDPPNSRTRTLASAAARASPPFCSRTISPKSDIPKCFMTGTS